jgi:uncharacterized protein YbjT (DUF2867 family)
VGGFFNRGDETARRGIIRMQPLAADDVAAVLADIATAGPKSGVMEIAGHSRPDSLRLSR